MRLWPAKCHGCFELCTPQRRIVSAGVAQVAARPVSPSKPFCWKCWDRIAGIRAALALRELDTPAHEAAGSLADYNEALAGVRKRRAVQARRRVVRAVHMRLPIGSILEVARMLDVDRTVVEVALSEGC